MTILIIYFVCFFAVFTFVPKWHRVAMLLKSKKKRLRQIATLTFSILCEKKQTNRSIFASFSLTYIGEYEALTF